MDFQSDWAALGVSGEGPHLDSRRRSRLPSRTGVVSEAHQPTLAARERLSGTAQIALRRVDLLKRSKTDLGKRPLKMKIGKLGFRFRLLSWRFESQSRRSLRTRRLSGRQCSTPQRDSS